MNTMAKMRRTNVIMKEELRQMGYYDIVMFPHTRHWKDVFGLWDGIAKLKNGNNGQFHLAWLQFKGGYASKEEKEKMSEFCKGSSTKGILMEYVKVKVKYANKPGSYNKKQIKMTHFG